MTQEEKALFLEMVKRLATLETAFREIMIARRQTVLREINEIEDRLGLNHIRIPKRDKNQA